ncbi:MAG: type II toxin-antitoxin system HicB family antitoxin [Acetobacteraceae bacterium]|nr:type II toxin-antitoxin system HicB family antitoxin [Acetobacteraceae bacterium]
MKYLLVLEPGERNWSAYFPDVPGYIATGRTRERTIERAREALKMHLAGLREDGLELPEPVTTAVEVEALPA